MFCVRCGQEHDERQVREFGAKLHELDCDLMWSLDRDYVCREYCKQQEWARRQQRLAQPAPAA